MMGSGMLLTVLMEITDASMGNQVCKFVIFLYVWCSPAFVNMFVVPLPPLGENPGDATGSFNGVWHIQRWRVDFFRLLSERGTERARVCGCHVCVMCDQSTGRRMAAVRRGGRTQNTDFRRRQRHLAEAAARSSTRMSAAAATGSTSDGSRDARSRKWVWWAGLVSWRDRNSPRCRSRQRQRAALTVPRLWRKATRVEQPDGS